MSYLLVRHKIRDYSAWKKVFDSSEDLRHRYGIKGGWILRDEKDSNNIFVALECESLTRARELMNCDELKEAMKQGGVIDTPDIRYLEEVEKVRKS